MLLRSRRGDTARVGSDRTRATRRVSAQASVQIREMMHTQCCGDFSQACASCREEAAEHAALPILDFRF